MSNEPSAPEPYTPEPGAILCACGLVPDGWEVRDAEGVWREPQEFDADADGKVEVRR